MNYNIKKENTMKKRIALLLASVMAVSSMTVIPAAADEERPTISFFDKNSGIKAFDDRIAEELMNRTGVNIDLVSPTGDPAEKLSLMLAGQDYPDIILMDMKMPNLDGLDATKIIRELSPGVPIIALTAFAYDHDRKAALEAGCNDFLTKPFTQEKLKETIKKWVNK